MEEALALRLEAPRLLLALAPAPLFTSPKAPPDEGFPPAEGLGRAGEALGEGLGEELGRLALAGAAAGRLAAAGVLAEGRAADPPVEGRALDAPAEVRPPTLVAEGPVPPELQPRASRLRAELAVLGEPLLPRRLWSGCHFCCPPACVPLRLALALTFRLALTLALRLTLTFRLTSMSTSPW